LIVYGINGEEIDMYCWNLEIKRRERTPGVEDAQKFQHELMALKTTGQNFITEIREALIVAYM